MPSSEELALAPLFDGLQASVRAIIAELVPLLPGSKDEVRRRLVRAAAADIRRRMPDPSHEAERNLMLLTVARTFDVPIGETLGQ